MPQARAAPAADQRPASQGSGEFTRFFESPLPESRPGGELLNRPPAIPQAPAPQDPRTFTRLFGTPSGRPPAGTPPQGKPTGPGDDIFSRPASPSPPPPPVPAP